jgi:hypothetical protein
MHLVHQLQVLVLFEVIMSKYKRSLEYKMTYFIKDNVLESTNLYYDVRREDLYNRQNRTGIRNKFVRDVPGHPKQGEGRVTSVNSTSRVSVTPSLSMSLKFVIWNVQRHLWSLYSEYSIEMSRTRIQIKVSIDRKLSRLSEKYGDYACHWYK